MKILSGIIEHQRLTVPSQIVMQREQHARVKEGTSARLVQSGLDESWWADPMECHCYLIGLENSR